jgi:DNA repair protein RadC
MARASIAAIPDPIRVREDRAIFRALRIVEKRATECGPLLSDGVTAGQFFRMRLGNAKREHFDAAFLDNKNRLLSVERLFSGTIDGATVHARILMQRALAVNAAAVIVAHNHPSGDVTPSGADRALTADLKRTLALVDVHLLDHFVVSANEALSMASLRMV